jgi:alkanesulfonate monooxygenase SsuD/methylene tetrahydromethanopterin reductase-like flavin-dependent oxidoreductase (luciferase family)
VKFSVTLGAAGDGRDPAAVADLAVLAEAAGWDAFFLEDYLSYQGLPTYDPWVCLAAMAGATTRIRLGTTVTPLPRRSPWELAARAVSVDHLSGGRLILGVGSGAADDPVFNKVGSPMTAAQRAARLDRTPAMFATSPTSSARRAGNWPGTTSRSAGTRIGSPSLLGQERAGGGAGSRPATPARPGRSSPTAPLARPAGFPRARSGPPSGSC